MLAVFVCLIWGFFPSPFPQNFQTSKAVDIDCGPITCGLLTSDMRRVFLGAGKYLLLLDASSMAIGGYLQGHTADITDMCAAKDRDEIYSASHDGIVESIYLYTRKLFLFLFLFMFVFLFIYFAFLYFSERKMKNEKSTHLSLLPLVTKEISRKTNKHFSACF